jgi:hypothetical protein
VRYRQWLSFDGENDALNVAQVQKMEHGLRSIDFGVQSFGQV